MTLWTRLTELLMRCTWARWREPIRISGRCSGRAGLPARAPRGASAGAAAGPARQAPAGAPAVPPGAAGDLVGGRTGMERVLSSGSWVEVSAGTPARGAAPAGARGKPGVTAAAAGLTPAALPTRGRNAHARSNSRAPTDNRF